MKLPAKIAVALLPFFLTACIHKQQAQVQPLAAPIADNPPPPPSTAPVNLPPPVITIPPEPTKTAPTPPPKPQPRHHKPKNNPPPANTMQEAANPASNPGVSAIGQLSSGDPAIYRQETENSIASTEHGLNNITRPLSDTEQKTADQIRDFLKQAKAALTSGDVDGAHTLAAKAKVLLAELTQ
jgi:outer membrane biosynthesis protein TonB